MSLQAALKKLERLVETKQKTRDALVCLIDHDTREITHQNKTFTSIDELKAYFLGRETVIVTTYGLQDPLRATHNKSYAV